MKRLQSPSQTVGPFFHYGLVDAGGENILVTDQTKGQRIRIKGRVIDGEGQGVSDALIEIWQADSGGHYNHPQDPNHHQADRHFKGFGRAATDPNGMYTFETIMPGMVAYDDRTFQAPHINVRIFARGMLIHAYTRLYFSDQEAANNADPVLNLVPEDRRHTLIARREDSNGLPTYCFEIVLQGENETVFFEP